MKEEQLETICDRLLARVGELAEQREVTPQGLKQLSGVLKDLRELRQRREEGASRLLALEKELEDLAK